MYNSATALSDFFVSSIFLFIFYVNDFIVASTSSLVYLSYFFIKLDSCVFSVDNLSKFDLSSLFTNYFLRFSTSCVIGAKFNPLSILLVLVCVVYIASNYSKTSFNFYLSAVLMPPPAAPLLLPAGRPPGPLAPPLLFNPSIVSSNYSKLTFFVSSVVLVQIFLSCLSSITNYFFSCYSCKRYILTILSKVNFVVS